MQSWGPQALGDEFSYLENPRPVGAESSLTESASSPFQTEPRQADHAGSYLGRKSTLWKISRRSPNARTSITSGRRSSYTRIRTSSLLTRSTGSLDEP